MKSLLILCPLIIASCSSYEKTDEKIQQEIMTSAGSDMHSVKYPKLSGTVYFENVTEGIKVTGKISGLPKNSNLGFHIHENGACEGPDYKSAGEHFNPTTSKHGGPGHTERHFGDLGNLVSDARGEANYELVIPKNNDEAFTQIMGKAILIHAKKDDMKTQPSGNSGSRIACGIIKPMESAKKISMIPSALAEQGTMSTDSNEASSSEASMSGTTDEEIDLREEEVQLQEEEMNGDQALEVNEAELENFEEEMEN